MKGKKVGFKEMSRHKPISFYVNEDTQDVTEEKDDAKNTQG